MLREQGPVRGRGARRVRGASREDARGGEPKERAVRDAGHTKPEERGEAEGGAVQARATERISAEER